MKKNLLLILVVIFVLDFIVFANGLGGGFVYDDNLVLSHGLFSEPLKFLHFLNQPYFEDLSQAGLYRPLTQISFAFNFLAGQRPLGFHLINIILHGLNSFLIFLLAMKLFSDKTLGWLAAILFLVLPIHAEGVSSIVGRAELLSFFFGIGTILLWMDKRYLLSGLAILLALLSKETAIAIPAILLLLSIRLGRSYGWICYQGAAFLIYLLLRLFTLGADSFGVKAEFIFNPLVQAPFFSRIFTAAKVLLLYLQKIFLPYNLSADYSYNQIPLISSATNVFGWLGILLLAFLIWVVCRPKKYFLAVATMLFLLPYLIVSNLIIPIGTIMGDRLMYLPSLGMVLLLSWILAGLVRWKKLAGLATCVILIVIFSLVTIRQNRVWADEESLMRHAYNESPNSVIVKANLGVLLLNKDRELARRLALEAYAQYPDQVKNLNLLAALAVIDKNLPEGQRFLERALALRPYHQGTLENLSRVYFTQNKFAEAERTLGELATRYGGAGNVIFYAVVKVQNRKYQETLEVLHGYFGNSADETVTTVRDFAEAKLNLRKSTRQIEERFAATTSSFRYSQK